MRTSIRRSSVHAFQTHKRCHKKVVKVLPNDQNNEAFVSLIEEIRALEPRLDSNRALTSLFEALVAQSPDQAYEFITSHLADLQPLSRLSELLESLATELLGRKDFEKAERLLRLFPSQAGRWSGLSCRLAKGYLQTGSRAKAEEVLQWVVAYDCRCIDALRGLYDLARLQGCDNDAHRFLNELLQADASSASIAFAWRERSKLSLQDGKRIRIAVLSSFVIDQVAHHLDWECRKAGLVPDFYLAPFNQYTQEVLNPQSDLYQFQPDMILLALGLDDLFPDIKGVPLRETLEKAGEDIRLQLIRLLEELHRCCSSLVVLTELVLLHSSPHGVLDNRNNQGLVGWTQDVNRSLAEYFATQERAFLLPLDQVIRQVGFQHGLNPKFRYMASMQLGEPILSELARYCMRYIKPLKGLTKKCIVLDLDGTLWGGIVGEVGPDGIQLGPTAPGNEFVDFQTALLNLTKRGIILAVCSKNNPEDVLPILREHPFMVLREEKFGAMRINWQNKADNIREIAEELNIGLDAMVFIDDNPNERELIRQLLPEVLTVELPRDPSRYRQTLESLSDFELLTITKEDEMRVVQYQAMGKRQALRSSSASLEDYLHSLAINIQVIRPAPEQLGRLVQLLNKTNQFNLTTRRYQAPDVQRFMSSPEYRVYSLRVSDKFVDHGIVGAAIVEVQKKLWRIDSLLLSCRVMGLAVETAFIEHLVNDAAKAEADILRGEFVPTRKNRPAEPFYRQHGFELHEEREGCQYWELPVRDATIKCPAWITKQGELK